MNIQGTVSNTNMSNPLKKTSVWEATVAYININTTIYRHITTPISMKPRWTLKRKLIVRFRHQFTLAYHGDQGACRWNHRSIFFLEGPIFQDWSNHAGVLLTTRNWTTNPKNNPEIMILQHKTQAILWQTFFKIMFPQKMESFGIFFVVN